MSKLNDNSSFFTSVVSPSLKKVKIKLSLMGWVGSHCLQVRIRWTHNELLCSQDTYLFFVKKVKELVLVGKVGLTLLATKNWIETS